MGQQCFTILDYSSILGKNVIESVKKHSAVNVGSQKGLSKLGTFQLSDTYVNSNIHLVKFTFTQLHTISSFRMGQPPTHFYFTNNFLHKQLYVDFSGIRTRIVEKRPFDNPDGRYNKLMDKVDPSFVSSLPFESHAYHPPPQSILR